LCQILCWYRGDFGACRDHEAKTETSDVAPLKSGVASWFQVMKRDGKGTRKGQF
jgi:hypothetical protein